MKVGPAQVGSVLVLLGSLLSVQAAAEEAGNRTTTADQLIQLEKTWNEAHLKCDVAAAG